MGGKPSYVTSQSEAQKMVINFKMYIVINDVFVLIVKLPSNYCFNRRSSRFPV